MRDALPVFALRPEQGDQCQLRDADDDHGRGERADGVHVVGGTEPTPALERRAEAEVLDERRGYRKTEQGQPGNRRQHDQAHEERHRREDEHREDVRAHGWTGTVHELAGSDEGRGDERGERQKHERLHVRGVSE